MTQRHPVLPAFPVLQHVSLLMSAEAVGREVVCQPPGAVRRFGERPATLTADGDRPVGDDLGDHVQNRTDGPLAHGVCDCLERSRRRADFDVQQVQRVVAHDLSDIGGAEAGRAPR